MDGATLHSVTETGRALLEALDEEEPFRLLGTVLEKLQELFTIEGRRESTTVRQLLLFAPTFKPLLHQRQLVGDIVANQSHNHELLSSGSPLVAVRIPAL